MKEATNKSIVSRWFTEYWGELNPDIVDELATEDIRWYYPLAGEVHGRKAVKERIVGFQEIFPHGRFDITDALIADGDQVVARWEGGGTHTGRRWELPHGVLPASSGEKMHYTGTTVFTVRDGKIAEEHGQTDYLGVMQQLGIIEPSVR